VVGGDDRFCAIRGRTTSRGFVLVLGPCGGYQNAQGVCAAKLVWSAGVSSNGTTVVDRQHRQVHFLSVQQQEIWAREMGGHVAAFTDLIPFRHFACKNIGYLFAMHHHAQFVFDFDGDNILDPDLTSPMSAD
jgi:hypothetical protein